MVFCSPMADDDQPHRREVKSDADRTLLGVAPPRIDSAAELLPRSPVFVRSGTSSSDIETGPPSRAALPSGSAPPPAPSASQSSTAAVAKTSSPPTLVEVSERWLRLAQRRPVLSMFVAPVLFGVFAAWLGHHGHARPALAAPSHNASASLVGSADANVSPMPTSASIEVLEAKPPESLSSRELLLVAEARSEQRRADARALRQKLEDNPALGKDSAAQTELLRFAKDGRTARDALAAMASLEPPVGADLLYEVWTRTPERSDSTELARALVYSADVRSKASPALAVALALRVAETCDQFKAILPNALKDGDRRSLPLLLKLNAKRGCGPKKASDCFECLREPKDELTATINAVKSRHAPSFTAE
jgi:hypothetical protein